MKVMERIRALFLAVDNRVDKNVWIQTHAPGLTFADIGGLWGTVNEKVTVALKAGASAATMIDIQTPGNKWWKAFDERCRSMQVSGYQSVQGNICLPNAVEQLGRFDIVHCSGVLYHVPDIFNFLKNLYDVSRRYLMLTSMVIPDVIENSAGRLILPEGAVLSVPSLSPRDRAVLVQHFDDMEVTVEGINAQNAQLMDEHGRFKTGPWWWLFSPETMRRLVTILPFEVMDGGFTRRNWTYSLLLRRLDAPAGGQLASTSSALRAG